jgi:hypothetical protein
VLPVAFGLQRSADAPDTVQDPSRRVLSRLELWGFLYGPVAYARAVRWRRRLARTATGRSGKTP